MQRRNFLKTLGVAAGAGGGEHRGPDNQRAHQYLLCRNPTAFLQCSNQLRPSGVDFRFQMVFSFYLSDIVVLCRVRIVYRVYDEVIKKFRV